MSHHGHGHGGGQNHTANGNSNGNGAKSTTATTATMSDETSKDASSKSDSTAMETKSMDGKMDGKSGGKSMDKSGGKSMDVKSAGKSMDPGAQSSGTTGTNAGVFELLTKRVVERPFRSIGMALLAGAFLGYESPRRGIVMGALRMLVLSELRSFAEGMPSKYADLLRNPLQAAANAASGVGGQANHGRRDFEASRAIS